MITCMGPGYEVTIIEDNKNLANLATYICPEATVAHASSIDFLTLLESSENSNKPKELSILHGVNNEIANMPIASSVFPIHGIDITIYTHVPIPFQCPFSAEFETYIRILKYLMSRRNLENFILTCSTACTNTNKDIDTSPIQELFPTMYISAAVINTAVSGDAIAAY